MTNDDEVGADLVQVPQVELELEPSESDTHLNADLARMGIDTASLMQQALEQTRMAIAISDPHQPDNPIVYINQAFTELTGYGQQDASARTAGSSRARTPIRARWARSGPRSTRARST